MFIICDGVFNMNFCMWLICRWLRSTTLSLGVVWQGWVRLLMFMTN